MTHPDFDTQMRRYQRRELRRLAVRSILHLIPWVALLLLARSL